MDIQNAAEEVDALAQAMGDSGRRMHAWPVLVRKMMRTLWETRNPMAAMFAWQSNINYRTVSTG